MSTEITNLYLIYGDTTCNLHMIAKIICQYLAKYFANIWTIVTNQMHPSSNVKPLQIFSTYKNLIILAFKFIYGLAKKYHIINENYFLHQRFIETLQILMSSRQSYQDILAYSNGNLQKSWLRKGKIGQSTVD